MSSDVRMIETQINFDTVQDQVASILYAVGEIKHSDNVVSIEFYGEPYISPLTKKTVLPIRVNLKRREEVSV